VAVALTVTGCSSAQSIDPNRAWTSADIQARAEYLRDQGNDFVADRFADGEVTQEEYREGVDMFVTCMNDRGYTTTYPIVSPTDGVSILVEPDPSGKTDEVFGPDLQECGKFKGELEALYPITHPQVMDAPLLVAVSSCLENKGITVPDGARNYPDLKAADPDTDYNSLWKQAFDECLVTNVFTLYPDLPGVAIYG
jgi:hypothetical protein